MLQKYVLVGAGGTGSQFIGPVLAFLQSWHDNNETEWEFTVVDGDNYHSDNASRQLFEPRFVGMNKSEAMAEQYNQYPIKFVPKYIGMDELEYLMTENTIVFLGVDNYSVRALVEERALNLDSCVVLNAGNEKHDGTVQLWVRKDGENKTPRISYGHPEIQYIAADDRSAMTCQEAMTMPGGEQLLIANMAAAHYMLLALWRYHSGEWENGWTELTYDLLKGQVEHINMRERRNWEKDRPASYEEGTLVPEPA